MDEESQEVNPDNPRCPICGAVDWFHDPGWDLALLVTRKGTTISFAQPRQKDKALPVEAYTCRSCRFLKLRAVYGTLEWGDSEYAPKLDWGGDT